MEQFYAAQGIPLEAYRGQTLFSLARGAGPRMLLVAFLDSSTAAFGTRPELELLLDTRFGAHDSVGSNQELVERISEVNGQALAWAVFDSRTTPRLVRGLVPEAAKFEEFPRLGERLRSSRLRLTLEKEAQLSVQIRCADSAAAQILGLLAEVALMAQGFAVRKTNPVLSSLLGAAEVHTAGDRVEVRATAGENDLRALLALYPGR